MLIRVSLLLLVAVFLAACGSKKDQTPTTTTTSVPATTTQTSTATTAATSPGATAGPGALQAEVAAAGAGDIPDNQVFVVYGGKSFNMKFPEGWTQSGSGDNVTFRDKNNVVRIVIVRGAAPTVASVKKEIANLKGGKPTGTAATTVTLGGLPAVKVTYTTTSAPNAVTGKRLTLTVDTTNWRRTVDVPSSTWARLSASTTLMPTA